MKINVLEKKLEEWVNLNTVKRQLKSEATVPARLQLILLWRHL